MSIRKFRYDAAAELSVGEKVTLPREEEKHLFKVLRAAAGDEVELLNGQGVIASAVVASDRTLEVSAVRQFGKPVRRIHLYLAPPRRQKMDVILHQAAELGVWRIVPFYSEYGVSEPDEKSLAGHWTDALFESCKQSGNPFLPEVESMIPFEAAVNDARSGCSKLFFGHVRKSAAVEIPESGDLAWFVGPEGGFSPKELESLIQYAEPIQIGNWILRVETAAVAGIVKLS